ncbi:right-handed parallel beta-helix repeat-containing protein [Sorangium sp. So ce1128]
MKRSFVLHAALLTQIMVVAVGCGSSENDAGAQASGAGGAGGEGQGRTTTLAGSGSGPASGAGGATGSGGAGSGGGSSEDPCSKPWPDATTIGIPPGTPDLEIIEGDIHTEQDGQVFDAVELRGRLYLDHKDITIKRSRLIGDQYYAVYATDSASGLTIEDSEVTGGVGFPDHTTVRRTHAHSGFGHDRDDGFIFAASHVLIEDCLIDGLAGSDGAHVDGIQSMGGSDIVFRHNWVDPTSPPIADGGVNAAIFVTPDKVPSSDVTVECNMMLGGESWYPLRLYSTSGQVVVRGNRFDRNFLGVPVHLDETTPTVWEDNAYADDGEVIPAP